VAVRVRVPGWAALTGAGWLGALCFFGASYVWALLGGPRVVLVIASVPAVGAAVALGAQLGRRRAWWGIPIAAAAGAVVLVCGAEAAWVATLFVPYAGGSGGFLAILAPFFIAALVFPVGTAVLAVLLGSGAVLGLPLPARPALRWLTVPGALLAAAGVAALVIAATSQAGSFGEVVNPTRGSATAVWKGPHGATLALGRDSTFSASGLPVGLGEWSNGQTPATGSGTWHSGSLDPGSEQGVILDFSNGSQAELLLETDGPTLAMYYDLGDPDEGWSGQYRLVRQGAR
jgi:hypothetical protein